MVNGAAARSKTDRKPPGTAAAIGCSAPRQPGSVGDDQENGELVHEHLAGHMDVAGEQASPGHHTGLARFARWADRGSWMGHVFKSLEPEPT